MTRDELPGLTGLRGLAALVVVLYHYRVPGFGYGWLAVDVFFALSGYVLSHVYRDGLSPGEFLWARFARTWPTHLVASSAVGIAIIACHPEAIGFRDLLANLVLIGALNPPTWSLIIEWYAYLLLAVLGMLSLVHRMPGWPLFIAGIVIGLVGIAYDVPDQIGVSNLARGFGWFAAGMGLYRVGWRPVRTWALDNRLVLWLGGISYPLYLIHWLPGYILSQAMYEPWIVTQLAGIPAALVLAVLLHYVIEDPARRWLRGWNWGRGWSLVLEKSA